MLELVFLIALGWGIVAFATGAIVAVGAAADDRPPEADAQARLGRPPSPGPRP